MKTKWSAMAAAGMVIFLSGAGCESPDVAQPGPTDIDPYRISPTPDDLIERVEGAFQEHDLEAYSAVLSGDFVYEADEQTRLNYPLTDWCGWGADQEKACIARLFESRARLDLNLRNPIMRVETLGGTTMAVEMSYSLTVGIAFKCFGRYGGHAELVFRLLGSFWYLERWTDLESVFDPDTGEPLPTMGSLRGLIAGT